MTEQTITAILNYVQEHPRCTAQEAGTTVPYMNELEAAGKIKRAGNRATGKRGRPPVEWVLADVTVVQTVGNPKLVQAIRDTARSEGLYSHCQCDEHGLREDMTLADLQKMGTGCVDHWVCPRLDSVRRRVHSGGKIELEAA